MAENGLFDVKVGRRLDVGRGGRPPGAHQPAPAIVAPDVTDHTRVDRRAPLVHDRHPPAGRDRLARTRHVKAHKTKRGPRFQAGDREEEEEEERGGGDKNKWRVRGERQSQEEYPQTHT